DEVLAVADACEQLAQGMECVSSQLALVSRGLPAVKRLSDQRQALEDRKDPGQCRRVARQQEARFLAPQASQIAGERVNQSVHRLIGNRLLLVAAPGKRDDVRLA